MNALENSQIRLLMDLHTFVHHVNGILKDTNLSSNGYNSSSFGLSGNSILLAMDSLGILCCLIEP
jgi:hypothetical protein